MKTYDFTIRPRPVHVRTGEPMAKADANVENGWEAYASWLRRLREEVSERHAPLPPDLIP